MTFRAQGMRAWLVQRLSAVYLAVFLIAVVIWYFSTGEYSYDQWRHLVGHPLVNVALALCFIALLVHAWVGMRDVLVDYVPAMGLRFIILIGIAATLVAMGVWTALLLMSVFSP
jgi:succinate dehydrogenase / fumarate reductase, membrane anchor subunit